MMTVRQLLRTAVICVAAASSQAQGLDEALFPGLDRHSDESIRLHGLAQLYPGRVLFEAPQLTTVTESRVATRVEDLPREIKYVRLYRLDEAQAVLEAFQSHQALILDFRFLKSEDTAIDLFDHFATTGWTQELTTIGTVPAGLIETDLNDSYTLRDTPVIVLCNRETAGPFEAILHTLQGNGSIIAVGEPTAGHTGFYEPTVPNAWILNGEIRPDHDTSLVGSGFLPRIQIALNAEANYLTYHLYEAGTDITQLLRKANQTTAQSDDTLNDHDIPIETDQILQRGVDIIAALQTLQHQPEL
ncbi:MULTISPECIES: S41 family peptidase [unclassified Lentimonas]|uniref:S41 family peptidase n=1 Tax=unclassified Lentimonas TaxID=2630993 RepID=UPI001323FE22|nr:MULTISPECIES: S41 family peptidase [unclassified Lentimonas]CAA6693810.1 Unannotated [Lentimonas sp. CC19]CAA6695110.1 Unannotated [Lentimonas sp. CC10]CAA7069689.1 Unannotated [Lentimonas sp. CC11]